MTVVAGYRYKALICPQEYASTALRASTRTNTKCSGELDAVIVDNGYATGNSMPGNLGVVTDDDVSHKLARQILRCNVAQYDRPWLHDPTNTAEAIMGVVNG